jgi:hypothetical protein
MHPTLEPANPAVPRYHWKRHLAVAALTILIVIALNVFLIKWLLAPGPGSVETAAQADQLPDNAASVQNVSSDPPTDIKGPTIKITKGNADSQPNQTPPSTKELTPAALPKVTIKRLEPAEPRAGESLDVALEAEAAKNSKLTYQYRLKPDEKWKIAEGGRIKIYPLPPGPLTLEVRVVDELGRASPIVTRRLTVKPGPEQAEKITARFKAGDKFYQEVIVTRQSAYRVLGLELGQNVQYGFISSFTVDKVDNDGSVVVTQKIETARFGEGDAELKTLLADALRKTEGASFEMTVSPAGEVTRFKGAKEPPKVFGDKNPLGGQTFLLWSFLDDDSWKELAQITFLQPDKPLRKGAVWTRDLSHSWGPLGNWTGKTAYAAMGKQAGLDRINYAHDMTYQAPRGAGRDLPFQVQKADFKPQTAGGAILFDAGKSRVAAAEETFRVRGTLVLSVAGTEATVEMDEAQLFRLRVLEQKPAK